MSFAETVAALLALYKKLYLPIEEQEHMNDSIHIIRRGRVVREPNIRQVGDKTLVTLTVAENPIGEKAKARYKTMFIDGTFSGREGERAAEVGKGAVVGWSGQLGMRTYDKKDGGEGVAFEIPYASGLIVYEKGDVAGAGSKLDATPEKATGPGPFDF